jgi:hypothetical protein
VVLYASTFHHHNGATNAQRVFDIAIIVGVIPGMWDEAAFAAELESSCAVLVNPLHRFQHAFKRTNERNVRMPTKPPGKRK